MIRPADLALVLLIAAGAVVLARAALATVLALSTLAGPPPGCC